MTDTETIQMEFVSKFAAPPERVVRAPGRVNLIGEHTDYNDGFVLPMAIDREIMIAARRRRDRRVHMVALDYRGESSEFSLDASAREPLMRSKMWATYVRGVATLLKERGIEIPGLDLVISGNVPIGSGLSSSAALEVCAATLFLEFSPVQIGKVELAKLCQQAENDFVGVKSGIMDQFISVLAREGNALLIDCRDLGYEHVPIPQDAAIVVCDTMKRRGLVASEYNTRRAECEEAVRWLRERMGQPIRALRDVSAAEFARFEKELPVNIAKRARHVISENERVTRAVVAMKENDLQTLGRLMNESHASLKNDYEVSSPELDAMVEVARKQPGCLGARLTGAGFGGCTVNLVMQGMQAPFMSRVAEEYHARTGLEPHIFFCRASEGAGPAWRTVA